MSVNPDERPQAIALDTSVIISGLLSWHEHHRGSAAALAYLVEGTSKLILPLQALLEAYAVMTRLPPPYRLSPKDALEILDGSLSARVVIVGLDGDEGWRCLEDLERSSIAGGTTYDGAVLAAARKGGATQILTLNRGDFERLATEGIEIVVPASV